MEGETTPTQVSEGAPKAEVVKPKSNDKGTLTITIATNIRASMQALADERGLGEDPSELLKNLLLVGYLSPEGCTFKLKPVNGPKEDDKRQMALPLQ